MDLITQAKLKLPMEFIEYLYKNNSLRVANNILTGMTSERYTTLRANNIKTDITEIKRILNEKEFEFEECEFWNQALIIKNKNEFDLQKLDIYKEGKIYIQTLSSMIPPLVLNTKPGERVLDLTAAPGSKTTQLATLMKNEGYIFANELDQNRCEKLKYNVKLQGASIVEVNCGDGQEIYKKHKNEFDKVLLDTPCSGEGRFLINDVKTFKSWSTKLISDLTKIQKKLVDSAYESLKSGGEMVYSTCTLNKEENEKIIDYAVKKYNMEILDINLKFRESYKASNKGVANEVEKAMKIIPSKNMEGFFICRLKK